MWYPDLAAPLVTFRQSLGDEPVHKQTRGLGVEFEGISDDELGRLEAYIASRGKKSRFR